MDQEFNFGQAVQLLQSESGESFGMGLEQSKEMMAQTLKQRSQISRMEQTRVNPPAAEGAEAGTWYF